MGLVFNQLFIISTWLLPWIQLTAASECHTGCMCYHQGITYSTHCINQNLRQIPIDIPDTTSQLHLEGNTFRVMSKNSFSGFPLLRSLALNRCNIEELESEVFHGLVDLSWIDLKHNKIRILRARTFSGLPSLSRLELDHNLLSVIEDLAFSGIGTVMLGVSINLQVNPTLGSICEHAFRDAQVETLLISNSSLTSQSLQAIRDLRNSLRLLFLKNNQIPLEIPVDLFTGFNLRSLDLSNNGITGSGFLQHVHTEVLSMPDNPIGPTNFSIYAPLNSVRDLYLDNTGFSDLDYSYFSTLTSLQKIQLANNNIVTIPSNMRAIFQRLGGISLVSNPLHCNCDLKWLHSFVKRKQRVFSLGAECATPVRASMFQMSASQFRCSAPASVTISEYFMDGSAMLQCQTQADPCPTITWTLPTGELIVIRPRSFYSPVITVYLPLQTNSTSGVYTCMASNHLGNHSNQKYVDIYKLTATTSGNHTSSGERVFSCFPLCVFIVLQMFSLTISSPSA